MWIPPKEKQPIIYNENKQNHRLFHMLFFFGHKSQISNNYDNISFLHVLTFPVLGNIY